jgi:hypothetical protein
MVMTLISLVVIFFVTIVFWRPYLSDLNLSMWRTRGMLNMIPIDIINNTSNLKNEIIGEDAANIRKAK